MRIQITCDIDDEYADPEHEMGVTNVGYDNIVDGLMAIGAQNIDVEPA